MPPRRVLVLAHPKSLVHARPTDHVVTDIWDVLVSARAEGIACSDLRQLLSGREDFVDATASSWRSVIDGASSPRIGGAPALPSLRGELLWELLTPFSRYAAAAEVLRGSHCEVLTDLRHPGPRRAALEAVLGPTAVVDLPALPPAADGQTPGDKEPALPPSHRVVVAWEEKPMRWRNQDLLLSTVGRAISTLFGDGGRKGGKKTMIVYGHYSTLGDIARELGKRYRLVLWPWAYPRSKDVLALATKGSATAPVAKDALVRVRVDSRSGGSDARSPCDGNSHAPQEEALYRHLEEEIKEAVGEGAFLFGDKDVTPWICPAIARVVCKYWTPLRRRIAAAKVAIEHLGAECVLIPNDTSIDFAPLALVAAENGVPVIVVAHGIEGSRVPGDKRLASDVLVWSEAMARDLEHVLADAGVRMWVCGPPHLEGLSRTRPPRRNSVLFLSYAVRHNTAWDSWMDAERYLYVVAEVLSRLGSRLHAIGIKIHPSEDPAYYRVAMRQAGLEIPLLQEGRIHDNLEDASVVVGPISTGLAEAFYLGTMPVCVNLSGGNLPAPCDGSTEMPVVTDAASLCDVLAQWLDGSVWPAWKPGMWPRLSEFVGEASGASRRSAEAVEQVLRT